MLGKAYRTEADFRLLFAIQTLFTMNSHQRILKQKREAARKFLREASAKDVLVFDFSTDYICVPRGLWIDEALGDYIDTHPEVRKCRYLFTPLLEISDFEHLISVMHRRADDVISLQQAIHQAQEIAVTLYANCDVSNAVRDYLKDYINPNVSLYDSQQAVGAVANQLILAIFRQLKNINDGKLLTYSMGYLSGRVS